jgi:hypothetical protein
VLRRGGRWRRGRCCRRPRGVWAPAQPSEDTRTGQLAGITSGERPELVARFAGDRTVPAMTTPPDAAPAGDAHARFLRILNEARTAVQAALTSDAHPVSSASGEALSPHGERLERLAEQMSADPVEWAEVTVIR